MPWSSEHELVEPGVQLRQFRVELPLLFRDGERHCLERMRLDADQHHATASARPPRPRQARHARRFAAQIPPASRRRLHADPRRKIVPILSGDRSGTRNAFQFRFQFKIVHGLVGRAVLGALFMVSSRSARNGAPWLNSQRFNFRFAANTRHETVVSEQRKTCAASAWFNPS